MPHTVDEVAANRLGDTQLDPLEEVLFRGWMRANGLMKRRMTPEDVEPPLDYRGLYRNVGGQVMPHGLLKQTTQRVGSQQALEQVMLEREEEQIKQLQQAQDREIKQREHDEDRNMKLQTEQNTNLQRLQDSETKQREHLEDRNAKLQEHLEDRVIKLFEHAQDRRVKQQEAKSKTS